MLAKRQRLLVFTTNFGKRLVCDVGELVAQLLGHLDLQCCTVVKKVVRHGVEKGARDDRGAGAAGGHGAPSGKHSGNRSKILASRT